MDKQIMMYSYHRILFSNKKRTSIDIYKNTDESQKLELI